MKQQTTLLKASVIFGIATAYFFLLLYTLLPFLKSTFSFNSTIYWFIIGYFLFIPLFVSAVAMAKKEGNKKYNQILQSLNIKQFSKKDWNYAILGLISVFIITGFIFLCSILLNKYFGVRLLTTTPWFIEITFFVGIEKLLLLAWLPMFFFNILGEEMLWRGYIQSRLKGKYSWLFCSLLWMIFHLPFGIDLVLILMPVIIIIPYIFYKTQNTLVGVFIHGVYNGPLFVLVALGLIH
jgi:membrane protease YdiL (CAAX protease family)